MSKVLWHITMSLDGFVAGPGGDMSWMGDYADPNPTVNEVLGQIGAVLIGGRTYDGAKTEQGKVYGGAWSGPQFVLTHAASNTAASGFTFVAGDIGEVMRKVKAAAGNNYVAIIGPTAAKEILYAGLLDEILIHIVPVLLGDGVRLFEHSGGTTVKLELIRLTHSQSQKVTNMWLRVKH